MLRKILIILFAPVFEVLALSMSAFGWAFAAVISAVIFMMWIISGFKADEDDPKFFLVCLFAGPVIFFNMNKTYFKPLLIKNEG